MFDPRHLIYDSRTGDVIDSLTGEVVDRIYVYQPPRQRDCVDEVITTVVPVYLSDDIHPLYLYNKLRYYCLVDVLELLDHLRSSENIPVSDYEFELTLRYILKKLGRHPYTTEFKVALIYIVLEIIGVHVDVKTLSRVFGVSEHKLKSMILMIKRELYEAGVKTRKPIEDKMISLLKQYSAKLRLPTDIVLSASRVIRSKPYPSRFTPRTLVLAIIYCELERHGIKLSDPTGTKTCTSNLSLLRKIMGLSHRFSKTVEFVKKYYYGEGIDKDKGNV